MFCFETKKEFTLSPGLLELLPIVRCSIFLSSIYGIWQLWKKGDQIYLQHYLEIYFGWFFETSDLGRNVGYLQEDNLDIIHSAGFFRSYMSSNWNQKNYGKLEKVRPEIIFFGTSLHNAKKFGGIFEVKSLGWNPEIKKILSLLYFEIFALMNQGPAENFSWLETKKNLLEKEETRLDCVIRIVNENF